MRKINGVKNSGYSHYGASRTKPSVSAWYSRSLSPHEDITDNLELLRERSRYLYAGGGPLGRGAIDRIVINSVGAGLTLSCRIDAESLGLSEEEAAQWENNTEREFSFWAESKECDITRGMNFYELQNLCLKSVLLNGDALVMLPMRRTRNFPYDLRIALIEGDRLQNPPVRSYTAMIDGGVEFDTDGKPIAYHITNRPPYSEITGQPTLEYVRVPAFGARSGRRNVLHLLPVERIGQHRGVPFLVPVIETLKQLGRYSDAELMAAVIGGMFAIFFEHGVDDDDSADFVGDEAMASVLVKPYVGQSVNNQAYSIDRNHQSTLPADLSARLAKAMGCWEARYDIDMQTITGPSAYDIAVELGYTGTKAQWLEALKNDRSLIALKNLVEPLLVHNAGAHNAMYWGKNLGVFSDAQSAAIRAGTFGGTYGGEIKYVQRNDESCGFGLLPESRRAGRWSHRASYSGSARYEYVCRADERRE